MANIPGWEHVVAVFLDPFIGMFEGLAVARPGTCRADPARGPAPIQTTSHGQTSANRLFAGLCFFAAVFSAACPPPPHHHYQTMNYAALQQEVEDCKVRRCSDAELGSLESALGNHYLNTKDAVSAEKHFRIAVDHAKKALGATDPRTAICIDNLATALTAMGRPDESIPLHQEACAIFEKQIGPKSRDLGICLTDLGSAVAKAGNSQSAFEIYKRAFAIFQPRPLDSPEVAVLVSSMTALEARSDRLQVSLPEKRWFLFVSGFPALTIEMNYTIKPGDERYIFGASNVSGQSGIVSVRLRKMPVTTARACREAFTGQIAPARQAQEVKPPTQESITDIKVLDKDDFSQLEYQTGDQKHIFRFLLHDGVCMDIHLSSMDDPLFEQVLNTVRIITLDK